MGELGSFQALTCSPCCPVAEQVLRQKKHQIDMEECQLKVQVQPVELPMVTSIQVTQHRGLGHARAVRLGLGSRPSLLPSAATGVQPEEQLHGAGQRVSNRA